MQSRVIPMFPYQKVDSTSFKRSPKTTQAFQISNYPGLCRVSGCELQKVLQEQVGTIGLEIHEERIDSIFPIWDYFVACVNETMYEAKTVLLAMGVSATGTVLVDRISMPKR